MEPEDASIYRTQRYTASVLYQGTTGIYAVFKGKTHKFNTEKQLEAGYSIAIMSEISHLLSPSYDIPA